MVQLSSPSVRRAYRPARPILADLAYGSDHHASHPHAVSEISAAGMCLEISPNTNSRIGFENGLAFLVLSRQSYRPARPILAISPTVRTITLHTHAVSEISAPQGCVLKSLPIPIAHWIENGQDFSSP